MIKNRKRIEKLVAIIEIGRFKEVLERGFRENRLECLERL